MTDLTRTAAVVALVRNGRRPWGQYSDLLEETGDAHGVLEREHGLLADELVEQARLEITRWERQRIQLLTILDPAYPRNLKAVHDRPPLIMMAGGLEPRDRRSVAVIGARRATPAGEDTAAAVARHLVHADYTVVSGLAAGIDAAVHTAALADRGRTIAVIGTGLTRCYPPQNRDLQRRIAREGAVISRFWPDAPPARQNFRLRNALMSGLSLANVVIEASDRSGARTQARLALAHGRPVLLLEPLLEQRWACELAAHPGVHVVRVPGEVPDVVERASSDAEIAYSSDGSRLGAGRAE